MSDQENDADELELVKGLLSTLEQYTSPGAALLDIQSRIDTLRKLYRENSKRFTPESIEIIRRVKNLLPEIEALEYLIEDATDARTQEQASATVLKLAQVAQSLENTRLAERARAVMKALRERLPLLRTESVSGVSERLKQQALQKERITFREQARKEMANVAPVCPGCRGKMSLRTGVRGDSWGCNAFPDCQGVLPLSHDELTTLAAIRSRRIEIAYDVIASDLF